MRVKTTTETPYSIKRSIQTAEFSVVTPEQVKFIKQVDMAFLSIILESDPDLTAYLIELPGKIQSEKQSNKFWFSTPEIPSKIENY